MEEGETRGRGTVAAEDDRGDQLETTCLSRSSFKFKQCKTEPGGKYQLPPVYTNDGPKALKPSLEYNIQTEQTSQDWH